jgi:exodeoxyribonuclease VII large subunit
MPDDIPTLADLRRTRSRRATPPRASGPAPSPSLFDTLPNIDPHPVTAADILAEQSRALTTPSPTPHASTPSAAATYPPVAPEISKPAPIPATLRAEVTQDVAQVFTVAELVRRVRSLVERTYSRITVEGEISNWRPAASGHCYFTLKDGDAQLSIVLFRRQAQLLRFRPKDGDAVRITGSLSIYESRGQMQLVAESMQQTGLGALLAAVQQLKEKLRREGIFDNKRPLPAFPRCIGIVTSLHGAALRDIVKVCRRRHADVNLLIYPAAVQGPNCPAEIASGVRWFSQRAANRTELPVHDNGSILGMSGTAHTLHSGQVDVILVARGGGSWEDLHGFDDETLCRTIAASSIPVLTGIGHATDSVLADSAADLCAPTPSAAAELVTAAQHGIADRLARLSSRLLRANRYNLLRTRQLLAGLSADAILARTRNTLERHAQHLDELTFRSESALNRALRSRATRLHQLESRLRRQHVSLRLASDHRRFDALHQRLLTARARPLLEARARLTRASTQLDALSPLRVLERGYALVYLDPPNTPTDTPDATTTPRPHLLRNAAEAPPDSTITAHLATGRLRAKVTSNT